MEKIIRKNGSFDEVCFSLRLMNVDKNICGQIRNSLDELFQIEVLYPYDFKEYGLILIENIDDYLDYSQIIDVIRVFDIKDNQINIYISMTTEYDMSGFRLPENISSLFVRVGGTIDFSMIVI